MTEFFVGDRVRVLSTQATTALAGRSGAVVWVYRAGREAMYLVRFDGAREVLRALLHQRELEPEPSGEEPARGRRKGKGE